jgi:glucose-1-phosphate thymidylyltransferase
MKGIVLAGGLGTRLYPLTKVTNKHLLPIYNKPMVMYPLEALVIAGITDILLITGGEWATDFARLLADFKSLGIRNLYFAYQEKPSASPTPSRWRKPSSTATNASSFWATM